MESIVRFNGERGYFGPELQVMVDFASSGLSTVLAMDGRVYFGFTDPGPYQAGAAMNALLERGIWARVCLNESMLELRAASDAFRALVILDVTEEDARRVAALCHAPASTGIG